MSAKKTKPKIKAKTLQSSDDKPKAIFDKKKRKKVEKVVVEEEEEGHNMEEEEEVTKKKGKQAKGKETSSKINSSAALKQNEDKPPLKSILKNSKSVESHVTLKMKGSKKSVVESKAVEKDDEEEDDDDDDDDDGDDGEVFLHGFSSADESSDDDDDEKPDEAEIDLDHLPTIAKDDISVMKKLDKAKKQTVSVIFAAIQSAESRDINSTLSLPSRRKARYTLVAYLTVSTKTK